MTSSESDGFQTEASVRPWDRLTKFCHRDDTRESTFIMAASVVLCHEADSGYRGLGVSKLPKFFRQN